jgi:hypothetical protein
MQASGVPPNASQGCFHLDPRVKYQLQRWVFVVEKLTLRANYNCIFAASCVSNILA